MNNKTIVRLSPLKLDSVFAEMADNVRNFGPLLPKINGKELDKFVYLRLNNQCGNLKMISIENEEEILVKKTCLALER